MDQLMIKLLEYLSNAEIFLKEEIPDVLQQMIKYDFYYYVIWMIVCLIIFTFFAFLIYDNVKTEMENHNPDLGATFFIFIFAICPCFVGFWVSANHATKITIAPKYYLIERVTELVRHK